jgi:hypothetical protein
VKACRAASGDVRYEHADHDRDWHRAVRLEGRAEHERLRDAVADRPEQDRARLAGELVLAGHRLAAVPSPPVDEPVTDVERDRAGSEPCRRDLDVGLERLEDELVRDRGDQRAGSERDRQPDDPAAGAGHEGDCGGEEQRACVTSPRSAASSSRAV